MKKLTKETKTLKNLIIEALLDLKGEEVLSLDLRKLDESVTDFYIVCHGNSTTQTSALSDAVYKKVKSGLRYEVKELNDILKDYKIGKRGDSRYFIQQCEPIQYNEKELTIDPYILRSLLGDGGLTGNKPSFTSADKESID